MRILCSNDDGILARGLDVLEPEEGILGLRRSRRAGEGQGQEEGAEGVAQALQMRLHGRLLAQRPVNVF